MSKLKTIFASLFIAVVGVLGLAAFTGNTAYAESVECGDNAIIRCGAMTSSELRKKYADNDRGLKDIFNYYNVTSTDVAKSGSAKIGYVHTNGTVTVDGKVVATGATTVGRSAALGGKKVNANGHTVYEGANRLKSTLSAYVFYNSDGSFKSAVLRVCGNPVHAKPVAKPVYRCDVLTATKISRNEYEFKTTATARNGATIKNYTYNFGDGSSVTNGATTRHSYTKDGTFTATVTVNVMVSGDAKTATSENCKVKVTVSPVPVVNPIKVCDTTTKAIIEIMPNEMKPSYTTDFSKCQEAPVVPELPETGIGGVIGGGFGAGALTLAGYYYHASRRML